MMFRVCMSVCYDIRDGLLAGSYVCTYGAILRIRLTEGYQSVENKRSTGQQLLMYFDCEFENPGLM